MRNLPDGCVEVEAEGEAEALARFETALWRGPSHARVADIAIDDVPPTGRSHAFTIA